MLDVQDARARMVERQLSARGVKDTAVLKAMGETPREAFVPEGLKEFAYNDSALPIEAGQTISQPYIVGLMIQAAEVRPGDRALEIGAGSGYAAAVLGRIADEVHAIERDADLAALAAERLARLGYDNVYLHHGDGTRGLAGEAPFDVILAAAGGPAIPQALKEQLEIGGRLIMPVGETRELQRLVKVVRRDAKRFEEEDLGGVRFVPLIGEHGWPADGGSPNPSESRVFEAPAKSLPRMIAEAAEPLPDLDDPAFGRLFDRFAGARVVLLGEASHGTSEFYQARAAITRRLIERHGFNIVAVEADWPDASAIDRHVRGRPAREAEAPFQRFPTWMWRNTDVDAFVRWLRTWNKGRSEDERAGFYGLDLYNLSGSIAAVLDYLDRVDPDAAAVARERYGCLTPWAAEPQAYGRMALTSGYAQCEAGVVKVLGDLLDKQLEYAVRDPDCFLDAAGNARLVQNAEAYYRAMYYSGPDSWNLRDTHMFETLCAVLEARGPRSKAVVWAHNSHIGDASKTEMGQVRDELNIGQLCRERFGADAALIGFGTHTGTVACASDWDGPMEVKRINPSRPDSYERLAHDSRQQRFLLDLRHGVHDALRQRLMEPRLERFIGVIYRPETERWSHYSGCSLPEQFDGWVWFDRTSAVSPLPARRGAGAPETWPTGL
ncbi:MAG: protein-L-isoaspartate(D-aspartate) O-methyltransferase [Brevundimonas sp.]